MGGTDWGGLIAAFGPTGALAVAVIYALSKSEFLRRDDPSRNDVLSAVRATNDKLDKMDRDLTDRLARIETIQKEHGRRLDKLE